MNVEKERAAMGYKHSGDGDDDNDDDNDDGDEINLDRI